MAFMDCYRRYVLSRRLPIKLERSFCREALGEALDQANPENFNTGPWSQFTATDFTLLLESRSLAIENVFIERFWRSVK